MVTNNSIENGAEKDTNDCLLLFERTAALVRVSEIGKLVIRGVSERESPLVV
jgi:hypothetical protein